MSRKSPWLPGTHRGEALGGRRWFGDLGLARSQDCLFEYVYLAPIWQHPVPQTTSRRSAEQYGVPCREGFVKNSYVGRNMAGRPRRRLRRWMRTGPPLRGEDRRVASGKGVVVT